MFEKLVEDHGSRIVEFDFDTSKTRGLEDFIPFVVKQVMLCYSDSVEESAGFNLTTEGSSTDPCILLPYKVLVPKELTIAGVGNNMICPTKLNCVSVPVNGELYLGRSEMLKKNEISLIPSSANNQKCRILKEPWIPLSNTGSFFSSNCTAL